MSDTISRQQAIDALKTDMASLDHIIKGMSAYDVRLDAYVSQRNQVDCDIDAISNLPPAQPDIIRCKDCKFYTAYDYTGKLMCKRIGKGMILPKSEDYCSYAERITDGRPD